MKRIALLIFVVGLWIVPLGFAVGLGGPGSLLYSTEGYIILIGVIVIVASFPKVVYDWLRSRRRPAPSLPSSPATESREPSPKLRLARGKIAWLRFIIIISTFVLIFALSPYNNCATNG